ncbi:MAG: methionyl-tRNA formyltransferase [Deltaproteobacteria bacterium]|jgi:methionyl-tRNA formyltransferase|nr:methionyl-tRNA formyltransferase [Deltaproteobacteria bacterium]
MKLVFFGSPAFALPALKLLNVDHKIDLVVTQPDRPKGRGKKTKPTPVKKWCLENELPVISPRAIRTSGFAEKLESCDTDYFVVVAYGRILTKKLLSIPQSGCLNIHPSALPAYRGPAPVNWALINNEAQIGLSIMEMNDKMDAGPIVRQKFFPVSTVDNAGSLLEKMALKGAGLLNEVLFEEEKSGKKLKRTPQNESKATYAPFLDTKMAEIDWNQSAQSICGIVRGLDPRPGAFTFYHGKRIKLFSPSLRDFSGKPGEIAGQDQYGLIVNCEKQSLSFGEIQLPGKRRMKSQDVLRGNPIPSGTILGASPES